MSNVLEIIPPEWHLTGRCPCAICAGEGQLLFIACPACEKVVLVCDEVGTVFVNPRNLHEGPQLSWLDTENDYCPRCGQVHLAQFAMATWEQIQALGFKPGEYA